MLLIRTTPGTPAIDAERAAAKARLTEALNAERQALAAIEASGEPAPTLDFALSGIESVTGMLRGR
jgi:hypothetical protein